MIEVERTVNASGNVSIGNYMISAGLPLAGQRVTLRLDGPGRPHPVRRHPDAYHRLPGSRPSPRPASWRAGRNSAATAPTRPVDSHPARVCARGDHGRRAEDPGRAGARRKTAEVTVEADTYQITVEPGITITAPRTTSRDIKRHKASNYQPG